MSNPDKPDKPDQKPQHDNRIAAVNFRDEVRIGREATRMWRAGERHFGYRAALTQFGVRFEPTDNAAALAPVTVPFGNIVSISHPTFADK